MYLHFTKPENVDRVLEQGLLTGRELNGTLGLEWVLDFYDVNPVYLTTPGSEFIEAYGESVWADYVGFDVDVDGLELVADLPSLVDKGARYDAGLLYLKRNAALAPLLSFADEEGWIEIEHLLDPTSDASRAAIRITGTAACVTDIPTSKLTLREPVSASVPAL